MSRALIGLAGPLLSLALGAGCVPASLTQQLAQQDTRMREMKRALEDLTVQLHLLSARLENETRVLWSNRLCKSGKIAEFIADVQRTSPAVCAPGSLETSLMYMNTQAYVLSYLDLKEGLASLHMGRRGQLRELVDPVHMHPSTRLLILVQPSGETEESQRAALELGENFVGLLRAQIAGGQPLRVLGPHLLPCRLKSEIMSRYRAPFDRPLPTELRDGSPYIRVWTFRSDC